MLCFVKRCILALALCAAPFALRAQSIGLVMSGGGAKGMVHLGVIKALEENEIPIDYITGTSIGAILGSMYACGYSVDEIAAYVESPDFERWQSGSYENEIPSFYKQLAPDAEMGSVKLHLRLRTGVSVALPTNLVPPYSMDFGLIGIYAQAAAVSGYDLNMLMMPFRAVSTNVYDKTLYAPRHGDLGMLVRASMSFPGWFKPTLIDSVLLFDGGLINNFPIDIMQKEFAPDLIIGSNCSYNEQRPEEDNVFSHIYALVAASSRQELPEYKGWGLNFDSLNEDNKEVGLLEFSALRPLMQMGYDYAMRLMPQIREQVRRRKPQDSLRAQRQAFRKNIPPLRFKNITINGGSPALQNYIRSRMTRRTDTLIPLSALRFYFDVVSDEGVTTFVPQARYNPHDSAFNLNLRISPAPNFKIGLGGYYSTGPYQAFGSITYSYHAPVTLTAYANLYAGSIYNSYSALMRADFRIKRWDFPLFAEIGGCYSVFDYYSKNPELTFSDQRPDFLQDNESFGFINIGTGRIGNSAIRLSAAGGERQGLYYKTQDFTSTDLPEKVTLTFGRGSLSIENNSLNFKTAPTKGLRQHIAVQYIFGKEWHAYGTMSAEYHADSSYRSRYIDSHHLWRLRAQRTEYFAVSRYFSLGYHAEAAYAQPVRLIDYYPNLLMLPVFEPLQHTNGLFLENFRSNVYLAGGVIPTYVAAFWSPNLLVRSEVYAFFPFAELSKDNQHLAIKPRYDKNIRNIYFMGSVSMIYQFPFANVSLSLSYYDRSRTVSNSMFFAFNIGYYLRNKRAFY